MKAYQIKNRAVKVLPYVVIIIGLLFALIPFVWILSTSFKERGEIMTSPIHYIPHHPTLSNFIDSWQKNPLGRWYINTTIVSVSSTVIAMFLAMFAGYGFSRFHIKGKNVLLVLILFANMFPACLIVIPYFVWMSKLRLINTYPGLIVTYLSGALPFSIWMLKGFFDSIPREMDQAAMIDGCNRFSAFFRVILPLSAPGISAATLYSFLVAWNNYLYSLILVTRDNMMTLNVGITKFISEAGVRWGEMNAVAVLTSLPIILAFIIFEKYMVAGISAGAVKG
jgi:ABC-type glycerol-3-phosphate transport system permease component